MAMSTMSSREIFMHLADCRPSVEDCEDLIANILSKLSVKTLLKCKIVCKSWKSLINKRYFVELHLTWSRKNPRLVVYQPAVIMPTLLSPLSLETEIAWGNGLVCCKSVVPSFSAPEPPILSIWNHATREMCEIPEDDSSEELCIGVSFGPRCFDYWVCKFVASPLVPGQHECRVYSLSTGYWRSIGIVPYFPLKSFLYASVNGSIYWLVNTGREGCPVGILSVDKLDKIQTFNLPEIGSGTPYLVNLGGCLGVVVIFKQVWAPSLMGIWVLESPQPMWRISLAINIPLVSFEYALNVTACECEIFITTPWRVMIFHVENKKWRIEEVGHNDHSTVACAYTESLVPFDGVFRQ